MLPEIELFAAGYATGSKTDPRAACATIMHANFPGAVKRRAIAQPLGPVTLNQADLESAQLALQAVRMAFRGSPISLTVYSKYVLRMLQEPATPQRNTEQVARLRALARSFPNLVVVSGHSERAQQAFELARTTAREQTRSDTGTIDEVSG